MAERNLRDCGTNLTKTASNARRYPDFRTPVAVLNHRLARGLPVPLRALSAADVLSQVIYSTFRELLTKNGRAMAAALRWFDRPGSRQTRPRLS